MKLMVVTFNRSCLQLKLTFENLSEFCEFATFCCNIFKSGRTRTLDNRIPLWILTYIGIEVNICSNIK